MNLQKLFLTAVLLLVFNGMQAIAEESAAVSGRAEANVERLDLKHGVIRIGGEAYQISPDVEVMDSREGGTMELRGLRIGSRVSFQFRRAEGKRPVVFYIEVHEMPLK
ncbi:MAG TPA: hypothetical protein VKA31_09750 [Mariprofundaceae bacterium]|nr:hypothetical protein [Mariprofundaceae bacterium]